ncbi:ring-1,2-phenylacetyl-CoA epoxidase subunit PaaC [Sinosporangium album]|uniref:Ring-1,2-phenylacetyl-CoA epoxidase subunit PaaC n=1 Tax=Sinosporangium album TaxID=504805 RepID=A0A1G7UYP8_9ACTN|nr:1,2-phenylacetyl-CoA epoxidase subunit PaaC [Sinosporangium album]SDG52594.1 ring-1,2-phenylacetyl-CoA epoxidase subunit PaaC [Sinosporangium album]
MPSDSAYGAVAGSGDDQWAFDTRFGDIFQGVDTTLPSGVEGADLAAYCLMLGDDALIMSNRLQQWCTRAPELEDEVAIAHIALDLLGQARMLLSRAGQADGTGHNEDHFAYFREEHEFRNVRLVEVASADFSELMARLLVFSAWRLALFHRLTVSLDPVLAALAERGLTELAYHRAYSAGWIVRLGDGTSYARARAQTALESVWPLVDELFTTHDAERVAADNGTGVDPVSVRDEFDLVIGQILRTATLAVPVVVSLAGIGGRYGVHTKDMGPLLADFQSVARTESSW